MINKKIIFVLIMSLVLIVVVYQLASNSNNSSTPTTIPSTVIEGQQVEVRQNPTVLSERGEWILFVYSSSSPDVSYRVFRLPRLNSYIECINEGVSRTAKLGSFECGYKCKFNEDVGEEICDKVCGQNGCRD